MAHVFDDKHLLKLLDPKRLELLRVDEVLEIADIAGGQSILDIGAGAGVFTVPAAKLTKGQVTAVDFSPKMVAFLENRVHEESLNNVSVIEGTSASLPNETYDRVLIIHLIHEVPDPTQFIQEIDNHLSQNSLITIMDWKKKETTFGPPIDHRISEEEVRKHVGSGYEEIICKDWNDIFYLMIFKKL